VIPVARGQGGHFEKRHGPRRVSGRASLAVSRNIHGQGLFCVYLDPISRGRVGGGIAPGRFIEYVPEVVAGTLA
jgi:hypothetical protein